MLRPLDIVVLAWVATRAEPTWSQTAMARELSVAQSNVHRALRSLGRSGLYGPRGANRHGLRELIEHAVRFVYPPRLGPPARGVGTAHSGPATAGQLVGPSEYVWPHDAGSDFGTSLEPLHRCVPGAALADPKLYELLAIADVFRVGRVRERSLAAESLARLLEPDA